MEFFSDLKHKFGRICGFFSLHERVKVATFRRCTDKKENQIFLIHKEIQSTRRAVAKSYMRKGFLIFEEMRKYFPIYMYEKAVSHICYDKI